MHVVALGIGYGTRNRVIGYSHLEPRSIADTRRHLKSAGFALRDVFGYIPFDRENPNLVAMMNHPSDSVQKDTSVKKGVLGKITPPGGKVEGRYLALADAGFGDIELAYIADGLIREADEIGCPNELSLILLNRIQGLPSNATFSSPDGKDLHVSGRAVRRFEYSKNNKPLRYYPDTERSSDYEPLLDIKISYSVGLNKADEKNDARIATCVANVWIPASKKELDSLATYVKKNRPDNILEVTMVDIRDFGKNEYPSAVPNLIAAGMYRRRGTFTALTGEYHSRSLPSLGAIAAYKNSFSSASIDNIISDFNEGRSKP